MQYKIIVDKQSRANPSNEKKEYIIDIEELRCKGDIYDSLIITKDEDYVIRKLELSEYGVLSVLDEPKKEVLNIDIELFEGDNYIYLLDMVGNKFYVEYLVKNDFNDIYVTQRQLTSAINESAGQIELSVSQKLDEELTGGKIILKINEENDSEILIDADKIDIDGKAVHFKTEINETIGPFTQQDKDKAMQYVLGKGTLTSQEIEKYDISKDGRVGINDVFFMTRAILNGGYLEFSGTYEINPYASDKSIALYNNSGYYSAIISLIYNYFSSLYVGSLKTDLDEEKVSTSISSIINMEQEGTKNSIWLQIGDWYNNKSSSGISIRNNGYSNASEFGGLIDIVAQEDDAFIYLDANEFQTEVSAKGITTPKLTQTSLKSKKKNIKKLKINALELVKQADICEYNFKSEEKGAKKHIGLVIGEGYNCPKQVISEDGQGVEQYSLTSLLWKAVQELTVEVENLKKEVHNAKN